MIKLIDFNNVTAFIKHAKLNGYTVVRKKQAYYLFKGNSLYKLEQLDRNSRKWVFNVAV